MNMWANCRDEFCGAMFEGGFYESMSKWEISTDGDLLRNASVCYGLVSSIKIHRHISPDGFCNVASTGGFNGQSFTARFECAKNQIQYEFNTRLYFLFAPILEYSINTPINVHHLNKESKGKNWKASSLDEPLKIGRSSTRV